MLLSLHIMRESITSLSFRSNSQGTEIFTVECAFSEQRKKFLTDFSKGALVILVVDIHRSGNL